MAKNYTLNIEHVQKKTGRTDKKHIKAKQNEKTKEQNIQNRESRNENRQRHTIHFIFQFILFK